MNRLQEIETRLSQIKEELSKDDCNIEELTNETDSLIEERKVELAKIEERKKKLDDLANGKIGETKKDLRKENSKMEINKRHAFCKYLLGEELSVEERGALTMTNSGAVVPEVMATDIIAKVKSYAPVLNDITLLHVNGAVKFAVEGANAEASVHAEGATISASEDTFVPILLSTYEITKLIQISSSVKSMSIDAFDRWLTDNLAEAIAIKIERLVFNGTGSNEPKGINKIAWDATNSVTVAKTASTTSANIYALFGLLKGGYARNAKAYVNRKTLFGELLPLRDSSKNELVTRVGDVYYLLGTPIETTEAIADGELIMGDMRKYVGNLAEETKVVPGFKIETNMYQYLGVANFDGKVALDEAFVKLVKASA